MLSTDTTYLNMNKTLARTIKGRVELYDGSTLLGTYSPTDALQYIHVERAGEDGKFFGFGVCQKVTIKLIDKNRTITPVKGNIVKLYFSANNSSHLRVCPSFILTGVERDEKTNILTLTGYDKLYSTTVLKFSDLNLEAPYSPSDVAMAIARYLGIYGLVKSNGYTNPDWNTQYEDGANFTGEETLRVVLNAIAEATQTIYFMDYSHQYTDEYLYFKALDVNDDADLVIRNEDYFDLTTQPAKTITGVCHVTDLGDNVVAGDGTIQYVRNNAFWTLSTDIAARVTNALNKVNGLTITPINCTWRGNFVTQLGDKIALEDKTGANVISYILNDSFEYNGGFKQVTTWSYEEQKQETATPVTLSEKINQTFAKIDKAAAEITLFSSTIDGYETDISQLQVTSNDIRASVETLSENTLVSLDGVNTELGELAKKVEATMTSEQVELIVSQTLSNGVESVTTSTGFTFDDEGLHISKSTSEMESLLDETGLTVSRRGTKMLTATSDGVNARNLTAQEYLRIETIRFEKFGNNRMGCFWIGD